MRIKVKNMWFGIFQSKYNIFFFYLSILFCIAKKEAALYTTDTFRYVQQNKNIFQLKKAAKNIYEMKFNRIILLAPS